MAFPPPALDHHQEEPLNLDKLLITHLHSTFLMEAKTTAMLQAGIFPKTRLFADRSTIAQNGDIIISAVTD